MVASREEDVEGIAQATGAAAGFESPPQTLPLASSFSTFCRTIIARRIHRWVERFELERAPDCSLPLRSFLGARPASSLVVLLPMIELLSAGQPGVSMILMAATLTGAFAICCFDGSRLMCGDSDR